MRSRLQLRTRHGVDPMLVLMDCSLSLMFAVFSHSRLDAIEPFEVPIVARGDSPHSEGDPGSRVVVRINASGAITCNEKPSSLKSIVKSVREAALALPNSVGGRPVRVRLEAHRECAYGQVFAVSDELTRAGFDVAAAGEIQVHDEAGE